MKIKTNYFLRNMVDLGKEKLSDYLIDAEFNYVILENKVPIVWASDNTPVIFGGEEDVIAELEALNNPYAEIMTELEFLMSFCLDDIVKWIYNKIVALGYSDGVNYMQHLDNSFNNVIDIDGMTDLLNVYADMENNNVSVLISSNDDKKQTFCTLEDTNTEIILNIVKFLENY